MRCFHVGYFFSTSTVMLDFLLSQVALLDIFFHICATPIKYQMVRPLAK